MRAKINVHPMNMQPIIDGLGGVADGNPNLPDLVRDTAGVLRAGYTPGLSQCVEVAQILGNLLYSQEFTGDDEDDQSELYILFDLFLQYIGLRVNLLTVGLVGGVGIYGQ